MNRHHSGEVCDDGNQVDGDGCEGDCSAVTDQTWTYYSTGEDDGVCVPDADYVAFFTDYSQDQTCGDGLVVNDKDGLSENCDDGNQNTGDGCSDYCLNEDSSIY